MQIVPLCKRLQNLWILVSNDGPGTNPPQIWKDKCMVVVVNVYKEEEHITI